MYENLTNEEKIEENSREFKKRKTEKKTTSNGSKKKIIVVNKIKYDKNNEKEHKLFDYNNQNLLNQDFNTLKDNLFINLDVGQSLHIKKNNYKTENLEEKKIMTPSISHKFQGQRNTSLVIRENKKKPDFEKMHNKLNILEIKNNLYNNENENIRNKSDLQSSIKKGNSLIKTQNRTKYDNEEFYLTAMESLNIKMKNTMKKNMEGKNILILFRGGIYF